MISTTPQRVFPYWELSPHRWQDTLAAWSGKGIQQITVPILWGVHETIRGTSDLFSSPRLKIEKLFSIAAELRVSIRVEVGFSFAFGYPPELQFPSWVWAQARRSLVPAESWLGRPMGNFVVEVPHLWNPELISAYRDFVAAVNQVLSLYVAPEGPIVAARVSRLLWSNDLRVHEEELFEELWATRFSDVSRLNELFGTSFSPGKRSLLGVSLKTLFDRRPWVAAAHYQIVRKAMIDQLRLPFVVAAVEKQELGSGSLILFDGVVALDTGTGSCFPLVPGGGIGSNWAESRRLWDRVEQAKRIAPVSVCFGPLEVGEQVPVEFPESVIVVCGKYLDRASVTSLENIARSGRRVLFMCETPSYDEWLAPLQLRSVDRTEIQYGFPCRELSL